MQMKTLVATAIAALFIAPAFAQSSTPRADQRQDNQAKRIEQGKASGQLNAKEAARLEKGQANVAAAEEKAKADGKVTAKERARIERKQDRQSKRIAKQKHDKQKTAPAAN